MQIWPARSAFSSSLTVDVAVLEDHDGVEQIILKHGAFFSYHISSVCNVHYTTTQTYQIIRLQLSRVPNFPRKNISARANVNFKTFKVPKFELFENFLGPRKCD